MRKKPAYFILLLSLLFSCKKSEVYQENGLDDGHPITENILKSNVVIIDSLTNQLQSLIEINSRKLTWNDPSLYSKIKVGDILLSNNTLGLCKYGFLRRCLNINKTGNNVTVETEAATLIDLFEQAKLNFTGEMPYSINQIYSRENQSIQFTKSFIVYDKDKSDVTTNDQVRVKGTFKFTPIFTIIWEKRKGSLLPRKNVVELNIKDESELEFEFGDFSINPNEAEFEFEKEIEALKVDWILNVPLPPTGFMPVKIEVVPTVKLKLGTNLKVKPVITDLSSLTVGYNYINSGKSTFPISEDFTFLNKWTPSASINLPTLQIPENGTAKLIVMPKIKIDPYGSGIVIGTLKPGFGLKYDVDINRNPQWKLNLIADVKAGVEAGELLKFFGIKFGLTSPTIDLLDYPLKDGNFINQPSDIVNGLIAHYPLDGNSNDASGNNRNLLQYYDVTPCPDRKGNLGKAYRFAGDGMLNYTNNNNTASFKNGLTVSYWVKGENFANADFALMSLYSIPANAKPLFSVRYQISASPNSNIFLSKIFCDWGQPFNLNADYSNNTYSSSFGNWHQWIITLGKDNKIKRWYDGILISEVTDSNTTSFLDSFINFTTINFGWSNHTTERFSGYLDDIRIYNRTLTANDVAAIYNLEK